MNATEITTIFVALTGFAAAIVVPLALRRMDRKQQEIKDAETAEMVRIERLERSDAQETVTLQSINKAIWDDRAAIKRDRDEIAARSEAREETHRMEINRLEEEHHRAIDKVRAECEAKIGVLRARVRDLEEEVRDLYRQQGQTRRTTGE